MNKIGDCPSENNEFERALSITSLTSFTPALTADNVKNSRLRDLATILERVVFPTPGGPQSMNDDKFPVSIMFLRMHPLPIR